MMLRRNDSTMNMNICAESRSEGLDSITKDAIKWNVNKLEKIQFQVLLDSEYFAENILEKVSLYVSEQKISNPVLVKALSKRHSWTIFAASDERRMWTRFQRCQTLYVLYQKLESMFRKLWFTASPTVYSPFICFPEALCKNLCVEIKLSPCQKNSPKFNSKN